MRSAVSQDGVGRAVLVLALGIVALGGLLGYLSRGLATKDRGPVEQSKTIGFRPLSFEDLEGWTGDDLAGLLETFLRSCTIPASMAADPDYLARPYGGGSHILPGGEPVAGRMADWLEVCTEARQLAAGEDTGPDPDPDDVRTFLEDRFTPVAVRAGAGTTGLFTGYYEPEMTGSRTKDSPQAVPLLARPADLVTIDLGDFRDELKGSRLAGRVVKGTLKPWEDRAAIEITSEASGGGGRDLQPLVWVDDPVDAFFLHIQGSGRVRLATGETIRIGYAGQNGHPYVAIGRVLVERGEIALEDISMQSIRSWLTSHPGEAKDVMRANTSYVFFSELDIVDPDLGPLGAGGTNLTPWRSLAVDRTFHALGVPVWLETSLPASAEDAASDQTTHEQIVPEQIMMTRLMVAQDTGGAIVGAVRGDVFFGWGDEATDLAGRMKQEGRMTLLLPNHLAARLGGGEAF